MLGMEINALIMAFTKDIMALVRGVMESAYGVNIKVGKNTLKDSNIFKTIQVQATSDNLLMNIILNDYIQYIESGRRAGAKFPPVEPIVKWARSRGIPTDNSTIYLIRRAISRDGISPRPIMARVFDELDGKWDSDWSGELFEAIMNVITEFFNR